MRDGAGLFHRGTRLLFFSAALFAAGCGYVGDPLPPLANIPSPITDVAAVQRGGRIIIHFTPPATTTETMPLKPPVQLDLRIGAATPPFNADTWAESARKVSAGPVAQGISETEAPVAGLEGKEVTIAARAIGANGKAGAWSNFVNLTVAAPPPAPADLRAEATASGVRVTWQGGAGQYRVFRRAGDDKSLTQVATVTQPEWVDEQAEFGKAYAYVVQRTVPAGAAVAESDLSATVTITPKDTFPPAAPAGIRAIAAAQSIELTWDRSPEPDFAAYRIYRAAGDAAFEKIEDAVKLPAYSDRRVEAGKTYRYQVSAVDQAGNESPHSAAITVAMPQ